VAGDRKAEEQDAEAAEPGFGFDCSWLIAAMADGVIFADDVGEAVIINAAARELLGIAPTQHVTRDYLKEQIGFYPFELLAGQPADEPLREELRIGKRTLHSLVSAVRDSAGARVGVVAVLRDFTDIAALAVRQEEFIATLSHELRTPLTSIAGALDLALSSADAGPAERQRRYIEIARESCVKLGVTVDDLLDVARNEHGRIPVHFVPMALDTLTRTVSERFSPMAEKKGVELRVQCEDTSVRMAGDPERLTQVLNNLLSNAIKFTPRGGRIEIDVFGPSIAASHVGVSVFNSGTPVPEDARERIFEKFEQTEDGRIVGGTGLGLAISRGIVEAHGGRIWVESHPGGSKFVFTLPASPHRTATALSGSRGNVPVPENPALNPRALVIESDRRSAYILKGILMAGGARVDVTHDTETALQLARAHDHALILLSAGVDDDSLALLDILKHDPDTRRAKLVFLADDHQMRRDALRAGADEYVVRPVDPDALSQTCRRLARDAASAESRRVMVVDDDQDIRTICREFLEGAGYQVRSAQSGASALIEARAFQPDLILLDANMPDLDGFQAAERFRADPGLAMTPIIFVSARGETADKVRAFRLGAQDYIVKPFNGTELLLRVQNAIERRESELGASPTTKLPGGEAIEREITRRLHNPGNEVFCYLDLDNLKAFNDFYGYAKADAVIRQTGDLIRQTVAEHGTARDFIGHIAGDDFVYITTADRVDRVSAEICARFDRLIPYYYSRADRERGHIIGLDRYGTQRQFPIMRVSIAAISREAANVHRFSEVAAAAAEGKALAKSHACSSYVRDGKTIIPAAS